MTTIVEAPPAADAPSTDLAGWWIGSTVFVLLAGVLPLVMTSATAATITTAPGALAAGLVVYVALRLGILIGRGRPSLVQVTFWAFVYLWMGLAALAQISVQRFPILNQHFTSSQQLEAMALVWAGILAYDVGRGLVRQTAVVERLRGLASRIEISPRRAIALGCLALLTTWFLTEASGGLGARFSSRDEATQGLFGRAPVGVAYNLIENKALGLVKAMLLFLPAFMGLYLLVYLLGVAKESRHPKWHWLRSPPIYLLLALLVLANLLVSNPFSNARFRFGGVGISLLFVAGGLGRRTAMRAASIGLLVLLLLVFPYADLYRHSGSVQVESASVSELLVNSPDYGMYQQEMNGIVYVEDHGHTYGRQTLGAVFGFVPRVFWKAKPESTGDLVSRTTAIDASSTLWTEANVELGAIGIVALFLGYGYLTQVLDSLYITRRRDRPVLIGALVPMFAGFQMFLVRGALQPALGELVPYFLLLGSCALLRRRGTTADAP